MSFDNTVTLEWAFGFLKANDPDFDGFLHVDHICGERMAHDIGHCSLPISQIYTQGDAAHDTKTAFSERLGL